MWYFPPRGSSFGCCINICSVLLRVSLFSKLAKGGPIILPPPSLVPFESWPIRLAAHSDTLQLALFDQVALGYRVVKACGHPASEAQTSRTLRPVLELLNSALKRIIANSVAYMPALGGDWISSDLRG
jgi:hypothetical protein